VLVFFLFPKKQEEDELLARYQAEDTGEPAPATSAEPAPAGLGTPSQT